MAGIIELSLADQILIQMHLAGWSLAQGRAYAVDTFGKPSRSQLTDGEKQRFIDHLRSAAAPFPRPPAPRWAIGPRLPETLDMLL